MVKDIILLLVGIITGAMNAIAGGGMLLGFPVLLATGLSPLVANVTTNIIILPGQLSSAFGYRKFLRKLPRRYLVLLIPCLIGGVIGALVLRHTSSSQFQHLVPLLIIFAVLLFAFQPLLHFHLRRQISKRSRDLQTLLLISLALLPTAVYGGFFGAGFGFIMLAFLSFTSLRDVHQMNALKNLAGATIAIASIICLFSSHLINWEFGLSMAIGNGIGGYTGARLSQRFSSHAIRIIVIVIGVTAATYIALHTY
jgi:uncharacterized membrane protein YfcA